MRREVSFRTLALIAVALATGSTVLCFRWMERYSAVVEKQHREILSLQLKHDQVETWVLRVLMRDEAARVKSRDADVGPGGTNPPLRPYPEAVTGPQRGGSNSLDQALRLLKHGGEQSAKAISDCRLEHDGYPTSLKNVEPEVVDHCDIRKPNAAVFP